MVLFIIHLQRIPECLNATQQPFSFSDRHLTPTDNTHNLNEGLSLDVTATNSAQCTSHLDSVTREESEQVRSGNCRHNVRLTDEERRLEMLIFSESAKLSSFESVDGDYFCPQWKVLGKGVIKIMLNELTRRF